MNQQKYYQKPPWSDFVKKGKVVITEITPTGQSGPIRRRRKCVGYQIYRAGVLLATVLDTPMDTELSRQFCKSQLEKK